MRALRNSVAFFAGVLAVCMVARAMGAEVEAPAPKVSFGVIQCGDIVAVWVITHDGKLMRMDATNAPKNVDAYNAFIEWINKSKQDLYEIPCAVQTGGKAHTKALT